MVEWRKNESRNEMYWKLHLHWHLCFYWSGVIQNVPNVNSQCCSLLLFVRTRVKQHVTWTCDADILTSHTYKSSRKTCSALEEAQHESHRWILWCLLLLQHKVLMCFQGSPIPKSLPSSNVVSSLRLRSTASSSLCQISHFLLVMRPKVVVFYITLWV